LITASFSIKFFLSGLRRERKRWTGRERVTGRGYNQKRMTIYMYMYTVTVDVHDTVLKISSLMPINQQHLHAHTMITFQKQFFSTCSYA
jgi:hypothetical protein